MPDLDIIIFAIAGVVIILISLYVVVSMTHDINETIRKCNEIGTWAKTNWKGEAMIENCPMRHENGNCIPAGGFCTANKNICEALLNAYRMGKAQLSQEGTTSDLISRTETVKRLRGVIDVTVPITDYDGGFIDGVEFGISTVSTMPTIQPVATDTNVGDKISRQEAIDELPYLLDYDGLKGENGFVSKRLVRKMLKELPPAQPESNCFGCKHVGMWENEIEYGYPSPCTRCKRRANDNYEQ